MEFSNYEGPHQVAASETKSAHYCVTAVARRLNKRVVIGEFPYDETASDAELQRQVARYSALRCATYDVPLRPAAWFRENEDAMPNVSFTPKVPAGWEENAYPVSASRDNCEFCCGTRGGVLGNENVVNGQVMCDYCDAARR